MDEIARREQGVRPDGARNSGQNSRVGRRRLDSTSRLGEPAADRVWLRCGGVSRPGRRRPRELELYYQPPSSSLPWSSSSPFTSQTLHTCRLCRPVGHAFKSHDVVSNPCYVTRLSQRSADRSATLSLDGPTTSGNDRPTVLQVAGHVFFDRPLTLDRPDRHPFGHLPHDGIRERTRATVRRSRLAKTRHPDCPPRSVAVAPVASRSVFVVVDAVVVDQHAVITAVTTQAQDVLGILVTHLTPEGFAPEQVTDEPWIGRVRGTAPVGTFALARSPPRSWGRHWL